MVRTGTPTADRPDEYVHDRRTHLVGREIAHAGKAATETGTRGGKALEMPEHKFEDELMAVAEQFIVKGKEQGYLTPDEMLQGFPEIDAELHHIFRIFDALQEIGIEVTDREKDFDEVEQIDDEM